MASFVSKYRRSTWYDKRTGSKYVARAGEMAPRRGSASPTSGNAALAKLKSQLRAFPITLAHEVARDAAPLLTRLTGASFAGHKNVYGEARPTGVNGRVLSLVKSGKTRDTLRFVSNGTIVRCVLAKPYMKYLIGKYGVLPNGNMPTSWARQLDVIVDRVRVPL